MKPVGRIATRLCIVTALAVTCLLPLSSELSRELKAQSQGAQQAPQSQDPPPQPLPDTRDVRAALMAVEIVPVQRDSHLPMQMSQQLPPSQMPAFPTASGAWALEVVTGGGLTGLTKRTMIDSDGMVACPQNCVAPARSRLELIGAAVRSAEELIWTHSVSEFCRDCMVTRLSLWIRNSDGSVRTFSALWDSVSVGSVPTAVRELHGLAVGAR